MRTHEPIKTLQLPISVRVPNHAGVTDCKAVTCFLGDTEQSRGRKAKWALRITYITIGVQTPEDESAPIVAAIAPIYDACRSHVALAQYEAALLDQLPTALAISPAEPSSAHPLGWARSQWVRLLGRGSQRAL